MMYHHGMKTKTIFKRFYKQLYSHRVLPLEDKIIKAENELQKAFPNISHSSPILLTKSNLNNKKNRIAQYEITNFFNDYPLPEEVSKNAELSELHSRNQTY